MKNSNIPQYVGKKIKEYRTHKNLTQQELAEFLNTTSQTISRYESGKLETNNEILFAIANYFNISINDFFPQISNDELPIRLKQLEKDKGISNLVVDKIGLLDEDKLKKIEKIIDLELEEQKKDK